jgi:hypothetical protein
MALGSTQPLTEMSTRNLPEGKGRPAPEADGWVSVVENGCFSTNYTALGHISTNGKVTLSHVFVNFSYLRCGTNKIIKESRLQK